MKQSNQLHWQRSHPSHPTQCVAGNQWQHSTAAFIEFNIVNVFAMAAREWKQREKAPVRNRTPELFDSNEQTIQHTCATTKHLTIVYAIHSSTRQNAWEFYMRSSCMDSFVFVGIIVEVCGIISCDCQLVLISQNSRCDS